MEAEVDTAKLEDKLLCVKILAEVVHCDGLGNELPQVSTPTNSFLQERISDRTFTVIEFEKAS
jgi:hypothetical protein